MAFNLSNPIGTGTNQELLDFTRAAIAQVTLHGQAYDVDGQEVTRADLRHLHMQEDRYQALVNAESGSSKSKNNVASMQRPL